jgi:hypothetical protein
MAYDGLVFRFTVGVLSYQQPLRDLLFGSTPGFLGRGIVFGTNGYSRCCVGGTQMLVDVGNDRHEVLYVGSDATQSTAESLAEMHYESEPSFPEACEDYANMLGGTVCAGSRNTLSESLV